MKKKKHIVRYTIDDVAKLKGKTNWKRLNAMKDEDIDCSDIPPVPTEWFDDALLVKPATKSGSRNWHERVEEAMQKRQKMAISMRLDRSVYDWFKAQGPRYQSRINAVLKAYMEAHNA